MSLLSGKDTEADSDGICPVTGLKDTCKSEWTFRSDHGSYHVSFRVLGERIMLSRNVGYATYDDMIKALEVADKVEAEGIAEGCPYVQILDFTDLEGISIEARKLYIESIRKHDRIKCMIFYGVSSMFKMSIKLAKRINMIHFDTYIVNSYEEAWSIARQALEDSTVKSEHALDIIGEHVSGAVKYPASAGKGPESSGSDKIQGYVDELLDFIGGIKWENDGAIENLDVKEGHPFEAVFDAIAIIKHDLDDLLQKRRNAEEAVRRSEKKYRSVVENANEAIAVIQDGSLKYANDKLLELAGYEHVELINSDYMDFIHPDDRRRVMDLYEKRLKGEDAPAEYSFRIIDAHGCEKMVDISAVLVDWAGDVATLVFLNDITERVKNQRELKKSEEKYRNILINMEEGYYEVDLKGNMVFFNDAVCRMLGYTSEELQGMNYKMFMEHDSGYQVYEIFNQVYTSGNPSKGFDWEFIRKDGSKSFGEGSIALVRNTSGDPIGFRGIIRDTVERKLAEKMREDKIKAEAENRSKSDFLANMSHEIRTPLNGIIGMTELAMDTSLDDNQKDIIHAINRESEILLSLINDILDFSKIEADKYELEEIPFDLRVLIEDLAGSFAIRSEKKGLELISFLSPDVPSLLVGDPGRLRQILANLVGNAMKFTEKGEVFIKAELVQENQGKICIRFSVKDTGIGISKDKQEKIFDIFTQADGSMTRKYGGTGLGLAISKELTQLVGGEIGVESEVGIGSTFWFTAVLSRQEQNASRQSREHVDLSTLRVLVVDDNETNRLILMEYLKSWGCIAVEAPDGEEAIAVLRSAVSLRESFDVIILDFQMPEMNGFDLAREIRKIKSLKKIPMIVLTSVGNIGEGKSCRQIGIQGYLTKPARRDELRRVILSVLGLPQEEDNPDISNLVTRHTLAEETRKNIQILLAEDYPTNQQVAMRHLQKAGYHVDLAENGRQALTACKCKQYDIVLMDIQMPFMDGYEATRKIRELEERLRDEVGSDGPFRLNRIPIIAMTAHAIRGFKEKCLEMGMDDYIAKPLRRQELLDMVDKWAMASESFQPRPELHEEDAIHEACKMDNSPINYKMAMDEFDCDKEFLMELLDGFIKNVREQVDTIRGAISRNDAEKVRTEAHSIKGGAANICAERLSAAASDLEKIGKSGNLENASEVLETLEKEFHILENHAEIT
ncbi:MAG: response regulator [Deltaproteobacteria bacterium]|nr:response regulator [Deltaproteobacteria bacterium]